MKKLLTLALVLTIAISITACRGGKHTIIRSDDNNNETCLELWGSIIMNADRTAVTGISSDGSLHYKKNNQELHITDEGGKFHYELNGDKIDQLNDTARYLLQEATAKLSKLKNGN